MNLPIFPSAIRPAGIDPSEPGRGLSLLRLGFRPFYLGAAAYAAVAVPVWLAVLLGWFALPGHVPPLLWHAHEMLFGFATAVIVGFLLTAGKAWTGLVTPRGRALGALVMLWLAARLAAVCAPYEVYAALDLSLLPVVAILLARVLLRAGNRRNLPLVGLLLLLTVANGVFHACALGLLAFDATRALYGGLALIVLIECVIAGRVVPAFTMSATPGLKLVAPRYLSTAALLASSAGLGCWVLFPGITPWNAALLALAAALQGALAWCWRPQVTRGRPILWILHAAYAWVPIGLMLLSLASLGLVTPSAGIHALAVGATGGLIIGMITRTARGHTGRALKASRAEVWAYLLVLAAAAFRVFLPMVAPPAMAWIAAATAWTAAFVIYLCVFAPWLMRPRADGKDG
ncbi:MAG: NnrS family protein [Rubrivivax sp.]|nr:MAG: NnrS family protein [Rubrivivax sp.]